MNNIYNIKINKKSQKPMYQQLANAIIRLIENKQLLPNDKLPPIRKLADKMGINNVTVVNAYRYLENKKVVYTKVGSGTYISEINLQSLPTPTILSDYGSKDSIKFDLNVSVNFSSSSTSPSLFPIKEFKTYFNQVLDRDKGNAFSYQNTQGYLPLRISLCTYLNSYNINTKPDKIQIISGAQQGIDIIAKAVLSFGDVIFVESPTYYGALGAFLSRGVQIIEIPMCNDGIDIDKLEPLIKLYSPKLIYIMSYFQTPTGVSYSLKKKQQLLDFAIKYNIYIIEEDNQSEFNYEDKTIVLLKSLDYKNKVIYVKSFSKILMPGLRLGFMVLPSSILKNINSAKYITDIATSGFIQRAFDLYLKNGDLYLHTKYMKNIFKCRYEIAILEIEKNLNKYIICNKPNGGVNLWLRLKDENINIELLCNKLIKKNVVVTPGSIFSVKGEGLPYIRISFADVEIEDIKKGISIIANTLEEF